MTQTDKDDVIDFLDAVTPVGRREDAKALCDRVEAFTGLPPRLWGTMVGYGSYAYTRKDGSHHASFRTGFAPRKANMVVYIMPGFGEYADLLAALGPHKTSASCLYLGRLSKVDLPTLDALILRSLEDMAKLHPA